MKMSITPEEFVQMQTTTRCLIECIFAKEDSFKKEMINGNWGWTREDYQLKLVHFSGWRVRVTVEFLEDYSSTDIYLDLEDVYNWYENEFKKETTL